jgi:hypothetical protein
MHHTKKGYYFQWGNSGKKYFYNPESPISKGIAKAKADRQGRAVRAAGWKE